MCTSLTRVLLLELLGVVGNLQLAKLDPGVYISGDKDFSIKELEEEVPVAFIGFGSSVLHNKIFLVVITLMY